jgi:hypothetical protein
MLAMFIAHSRSAYLLHWIGVVTVCGLPATTQVLPELFYSATIANPIRFCQLFDFGKQGKLLWYVGFSQLVASGLDNRDERRSR